MVTEILAK